MDEKKRMQRTLRNIYDSILLNDTNQPLIFEYRPFGEIKSDFFWVPKEQISFYMIQ